MRSLTRELGWSSLWAGRNTPTAEIVRTLADHRLGIRIVALSASAASSNERTLANEVRALEDRCRADGVILLLGGAGAWPERPRHGVVVRNLAMLRTIVPAR